MGPFCFITAGPFYVDTTNHLVVRLGLQFAPMLRASPSVEVDVATAAPSLGLALRKSLSEPVAWGFGGLGAITLAIALWYHHSRADRPSQRA